jgi:hypothetical protein
MDDTVVRDLKLMIAGGGLMPTGGTLYVTSGVPNWLTTVGFLGLVLGATLIVAGLFGS